MTWARRLWLRLQTLLWRERNDQRLDDELQFHLDQQVAENMAAGVSREEARYAATRAFGNPAMLKEETRDTWGWVWLEQIAQDIRYGLRLLLKNRSFTFVAVFTLALGIAGTTTLWSIFDGAYIHFGETEQANRVVLLAQHLKNRSEASRFSAPEYFDIAGLGAVTAEVASSSLVVPAILSKSLPVLFFATHVMPRCVREWVVTPIRALPLGYTWPILRFNYLAGTASRGRTSRATLSAISSSATSRS